MKLFKVGIFAMALGMSGVFGCASDGAEPVGEPPAEEASTEAQTEAPGLEAQGTCNSCGNLGSSCYCILRSGVCRKVCD